MRAPPGLVAAALALWGWSIGQLVLGVVLGAAYEALRLARPSGSATARVPMVVRACGVAVLAALGYVVAMQSLPGSLYTWLRWLPVLLLPIPAIGQLAGGVRSSGFARTLGRYAQAAGEDREVDTTHVYAAITLAAAGTGTGAQPWLYAGFALVTGWALLARLPRGRIAASAMMFVAAAGLGHAIHNGIWVLQGHVEDWSTEFLQELFAGKSDPFKERTRIGDLGRVKLSNRILMRVAIEGPQPLSLLLRESTFERYRNGEWQNARPAPRPATRQGDRWVLSEASAASRLTVRRSMPGGEGLLPLPPGTRVIEHLPAQSVEAFPSGAVRARGTPRFVAFTAAYDAEGEREAPDARADLEVPAILHGTLERTIAANGLRQGTTAATVGAVRAFFDANFAYSLDLGERSRTLADFLTSERKGHCEYFASATTMLLRSLGIPARYAAGYSVQEYSAREKAFVVRNRHAHAWVQAYVEGRWIEVDTTPSRWAELEGEAARGMFAPILDALSWVAERAVQAWMGLSDGALERALGAVLIAAVVGVPAALLLWRWRKGRGTRVRARSDAIARAWRGVETRLARMGHRRSESETVRAWVRRLGGEPAAPPWAVSLAGLAADYYRVRFDPAAPPGDAARFVEAARRWSKT